MATLIHVSMLSSLMDKLASIPVVNEAGYVAALPIWMLKPDKKNSIISD